MSTVKLICTQKTTNSAARQTRQNGFQELPSWPPGNKISSKVQDFREIPRWQLKSLSLSHIIYQKPKLLTSDKFLCSLFWDANKLVQQCEHACHHFPLGKQLWFYCCFILDFADLLPKIIKQMEVLILKDKSSVWKRTVEAKKCGRGGENSPRHLNEDPRLNGNESCQNFWYGDGEHIMKTQRNWEKNTRNGTLKQRKNSLREDGAFQCQASMIRLTERTFSYPLKQLHLTQGWACLHP